MGMASLWPCVWDSAVYLPTAQWPQKGRWTPGLCFCTSMVPFIFHPKGITWNLWRLQQLHICRQPSPHTTTILRPFFWDYLGEPVPEEKLLEFMVQGKINRGRHIDHPAGRHSIRTNQWPPPPSLYIFYGPDALPATQPTVSKHWRQLVHSD